MQNQDKRKKKKEKTDIDENQPGISGYLTRSKGPAMSSGQSDPRGKGKGSPQKTQPIPNPTSPFKGSENTSSEKTEDDPVLSGIKAITEQLSGLKSELFGFKNEVTTWQGSVNTDVSHLKLTTETNKEILDSFQETITYMEKTADESNANMGKINENFAMIYNQLRTERVETMKALLEIQERVTVLERRDRDFNVRILGLRIEDTDNIAEKIVATFVVVCPDLTIKHIEKVYKIPLKPVGQVGATGDNTEVKNADDSHTSESDEEIDLRDEGEPLDQVPVILVRFTDRRIRNEIFHKSKKHKFAKKLSVKEDYTKTDYSKLVKAKPQMKKAFKKKHKNFFTEGNLVVEKKKIKIHGVKTNTQILAEALEKSTLPLNQLIIPPKPKKSQK
jgi:hypothetical protein